MRCHPPRVAGLGELVLALASQQGVGSSRLGHELLLPQMAGHGVALAKHELAMCASLGLPRSKARRVAHPSYKHEVSLPHGSRP
uniref:Uncharacterized protein n=1 Tax=Ficus carica TaxID=3494 RepID=A0AA88JIG0_FICCA|nr:hypothetical protein TIFTF001_052236 [Ficus carica]